MKNTVTRRCGCKAEKAMSFAVENENGIRRCVCFCVTYLHCALTVDGRERQFGCVCVSVLPICTVHWQSTEENVNSVVYVFLCYLSTLFIDSRRKRTSIRLCMCFCVTYLHCSLTVDGRDGVLDERRSEGGSRATVVPPRLCYHGALVPLALYSSVMTFNSSYNHCMIIRPVSRIF